MKPITVYTTTRCPYCSRAKALLSKRGLQYEEIDLGRDAEGRAELAARTGLLTFPQIVIGEEVVGGYDELARAASDGRLDQLIAA